MSLFRVWGRICARRDDSFDSSLELLVNCGAMSDFMLMQTAKRARLPPYKLTDPGQVLTAGGVQVEVRHYTRAYVRVVDLVFRHHFKVSEILPDVVLNWGTMASKLQSYCQLEGTVCGRTAWFEFVPIVSRRFKAFHPAAVPGRFEAGSSFDSFIQYLESKSGWKPYTTCQGAP